MRVIDGVPNAGHGPSCTRDGAALEQEMESVHPLSVPLEVDIGIAGNRADA